MSGDAMEQRPPVLIVDDEQRIVDSLCQLLGESFQVVPSVDPVEALKILEQSQFAVILADQRMPRLAGDEFLAKAQSLSDATRILVTGYADIEGLIRAVNHGQIHTYVAKPWDPAMLRATVSDAAEHCREMLRRKRAAEELAEKQRALAESEAAFRSQTKLLQSILDSMGDGVIVTDADGKMVLLNPAAQAMIGPDAVNVAPGDRSRQFGIYSPGMDTPYPSEELPLARALNGQPVEGVQLYIRNAFKPDGIYVSVNVRPLNHDDGSHGGGVAVVHDITAARRSEKLLLRAKLEAERANRAKSDFLSRMSHELRTPLNSILGFAQVLEMMGLNADQLGSVEQIMKGGQHLLSLINEVLDVARIESGRMSLSLEPVSLTQLLQEVLDLIRPLAGQRGITIKESGDARIYVCADLQRLRQVLLNLLSNAIKYNVENGSVDISYQSGDSGFVRISIADTGAGISAEDREKLFKPFERLAGESRSVEGTGLGLALSKGLVEAMEGFIGVEENPLGGSIFWVDLLPAECPETDWQDRDEHSLAQAPGSPKRRVVLYIEDNPANLELMERIADLRDNIQLLGAAQGYLGLELARGHRPDLILLDLHLPDLTGLEVLTRLQHDPQTRAIPVVVVSADATPGNIEQLRAAGAQDYLTKPVNVASMLRLLDQTGAEQAAAAAVKLQK